jgi:G:T/U-mismatch repair DNA glycosylase
LHYQVDGFGLLASLKLFQKPMLHLRMRVEHRYVKQGLYTPAGATALLVGTFPSVLIREAFNRLRPTDTDFFYGSIDNNFWQDMGAIFNRTFRFDQTEEAVQQRKALLDELSLALSDAIYACQTAGSAMDTALQHIELNEYLIHTLDTTPSITTIYFTSSSGKVNAESLTLRLLKERGRSSQMKITQQTGPRKRAFVFTDSEGRQRLINTITLYSPSPLAEQWGGVTPEKRRTQYQTYLPVLKK